MLTDRCAECEELHGMTPPNFCCHCPCHLEAARLIALLNDEPLVEEPQ